MAWLPYCTPVRWDDQSQYPEVTVESFVGQSSMGLLCPPAVASKTAQNSCPAKTFSLESECTHTNTHANKHRQTGKQTDTVQHHTPAARRQVKPRRFPFGLAGCRDPTRRQRLAVEADSMATRWIAFSQACVSWLGRMPAAMGDDKAGIPPNGR